MDQLLQGVKFTVCWLDNILISGGSPEEHFQVLEEGFGRLQDHGIRLKVSVKVNLGVSLKFLVFANLEAVGCEVFFNRKKKFKAAKIAFLCFPP